MRVTCVAIITIVIFTSIIPIMESNTDRLGNVITPEESGDRKVSSLGLNDMPLEVLLIIFSYLDPMQLASIRLVCKLWQHAVSRPETWTRLFDRKFGISGESFPSVSNTTNWMVEYFDRARVLKQWRKAVGVHKTYELINSEHRQIDSTLVDFLGNDGWGKMLTVSQTTGNIAICNLKNGKNQKFIPGGSAAGQISSFLVNWNYLLMGTKMGDLCMKRLQSTTGVSGKSSLTFFGDDDIDDWHLLPPPILSTAVNSAEGMDKHRLRIDIMQGTSAGELHFWNLSGMLVYTETIQGPIVNVKSDFKKIIVYNTLKVFVILDYNTRTPLAVMDMEFEVDQADINVNPPPRYHFPDSPSLGLRNTLDVDYGNSNVVLAYGSTIQAVNYTDPKNVRIKTLRLPEDVRVLKTQFQTCSRNKLNNARKSIVGKDALLVANMLSDGSVIVWNVRDHAGTEIVPITTVNPATVKCSGHTFDIYANLVSVTNIALNSVVLAIGGYNGFVNLYNVYTGKYIRQASLRFSRQIRNLRNDQYPISSITLNDDQKETHGVILCADTVQYFQFGESDIVNSKDINKNKKKLNHLPKNGTKQEIRNEMMHYDSTQDERQREISLVDRYNGRDNDVEDELSVALAISESYQNPPSEDDDLLRALELSRQETEASSSDQLSSFHIESTSSASRSGTVYDELSEDGIEEHLRAVLRLSLLEQ